MPWAVPPAQYQNHFTLALWLTSTHQGPSRLRLPVLTCQVTAVTARCVAATLPVIDSVNVIHSVACMTHQPESCGPNRCWTWPMPWLMPKHGCSCHLLMPWPWLMPKPYHPWLMPLHLQRQTHVRSQLHEQQQIHCHRVRARMHCVGQPVGLTQADCLHHQGDLYPLRPGYQHDSCSCAHSCCVHIFMHYGMLNLSFGGNSLTSHNRVAKVTDAALQYSAALS